MSLTPREIVAELDRYLLMDQIAQEQEIKRDENNLSEYFNKIVQMVINRANIS